MKDFELKIFAKGSFFLRHLRFAIVQYELMELELLLLLLSMFPLWKWFWRVGDGVAEQGQRDVVSYADKEDMTGKVLLFYWRCEL